MKNLEIKTNGKEHILFENLEVGEFFKFKNHYYLKINEDVDDYYGTIPNAVDLMPKQVI